jgi:hypothetical protein
MAVIYSPVISTKSLHVLESNSFLGSPEFMMMNQMINELQKFFVTFGMLLGGFIIVGR